MARGLLIARELLMAQEINGSGPLIALGKLQNVEKSFYCRSGRL
jgi:hypothetical protein